MIEEFVAMFRRKGFLHEQISSLIAGFSLLRYLTLLVQYFRSRWVSFLPNILRFIKFLLTVVSLDSHFS